MPRIIDLSIPLRADVITDPPGMEVSIDYRDHKATVDQMASFFPGLSPSDLPDGEAWAVESVSLSTHNGTHLDAPWHYASTMNRGEPAATIDQIPLEW